MMKNEMNKTPHMPSMKTHIEYFESEDEAIRAMRIHNSCVIDTRYLWCVTPGPEDNFALVDFETAVDLGLGYKIERR